MSCRGWALVRHAGCASAIQGTGAGIEERVTRGEGRKGFWRREEEETREDAKAGWEKDREGETGKEEDG